jgi:hypothetical protein
MDRVASDRKGHSRSEQRNDDDDNNNNNKNVAVEPVALVLRMCEILCLNLASRIRHSVFQWVSLAASQISRQ